MNEGLLPYLLKQLIGYSLPLTIVCIVAILTAFYYRKRKPIVSLLTGISFFLTFISTSLYGPLVDYFTNLGSAPMGVIRGWLAFVVGLVIGVGALILLLAAIFGWRGKPAPNR
jgi:hypothetical protein